MISESFVELQNAWEILKGNDKRKAYDLEQLKNVSASMSLSELDLDDMEYIEDEEKYISQCRCGNEYSVTLDQLEEGIEILQCPGCSLSVILMYQIEQ